MDSTEVGAGKGPFPTCPLGCGVHPSDASVPPEVQADPEKSWPVEQNPQPEIDTDLTWY